MLCYAYVASEDEAKPGSTSAVESSGSSKIMKFFKLEQSCLHPTPPTIRTSFELQCAIARSTEKKE